MFIGNEESAAREVEAYNKKYVYFARSQSVRMRSTSKINVEFTIGDVVRHTVDGYHGVIVGWDHTCQVHSVANFSIFLDNLLSNLMIVEVSFT